MIGNIEDKNNGIKNLNYQDMKEQKDRDIRNYCKKPLNKEEKDFIIILIVLI